MIMADEMEEIISEFITEASETLERIIPCSSNSKQRGMIKIFSMRYSGVCILSRELQVFSDFSP